MPMKVAMPTSTPTITIDRIAHRRSIRAATASPTPWSVSVMLGHSPCSNAPGQEYQKVERKPQRDHNRGRDSGHGNRAAGAGADDGVDALLLGAQCRRLRRG